MKHGFSFPVFVWKNKILDGHQLTFVVKKLIDEGYTIGDIPVCEIEAKSANEAAEKLLALNSSYAKITDDGLYEFTHEFDLDIQELSNDLVLPEFDIDNFLSGYFEEPENIEPDSEDKEKQENKLIKCPYCGKEFKEE